MVFVFLVLDLVLLAPGAAEEAPFAAAAPPFGAASGTGLPPDAFEEASFSIRIIRAARASWRC
jgi:hypothetical protein